MGDQDRLKGLAGAIVDGVRVDWEQEERSANDEELRALIRELRHIDSITVLNRSPSDPWTNRAGHDETPDARPPETVRQPTDRPTWGHLAILDRAGTGAFGDVYRAWDPQLQREVALKLLRQEAFRGGTAADDLLREGRLLARVRHANVVSVFGADRHENRVGIWMEFVSGQTLEAFLAAHGRFGHREALIIGVDIARALAAVHAAGLVHGDVKAHNIMREDGGRLVLMDFGAGLDELAGGPADRRQVGTPAYLAPELLAGQAATCRSDIYSLGVLLFHLVTGAYPVRASRLEELHRAHNDDDYVRLRDLRPDLPEPFIRLVERALSRSPDGRFATAGEFEAAMVDALGPGEHATSHTNTHSGQRGRDSMRWGLRQKTTRVVLAVVAAAVIAPVLFAWHALRTSPPVLPFEERDLVLVAAFDNRTGNADLDGVVEGAIERELAASGYVRVVPVERIADTLRLLRKTDAPVLTAALALEVCKRDTEIRALVTGRVDTLGTSLGLMANVLDPSDGRVLSGWTEQARGASDLPGATRRLARGLRSMLGESRAHVRSDTRNQEAVTTPSFAAYRLYSRAIRAAAGDDWATSAALAKAAVEEDSSFAMAHAWYSLASLRAPNYEKSAPDALAHADRAEALAGATTGVERLFIHAAANHVRAYLATGSGKERLGKDAAAGYKAVLAVDPANYWAIFFLVGSNPGVSQSEMAHLFRVASDLRPTNFQASFRAATETMGEGRLDDAKPFVRRARQLSADAPPNARAWLDVEPAFEDWLKGDATSASARLDRLMESAGENQPLLKFLVDFNTGLGRLEAAEKAADGLTGPDRRPLERIFIAFNRSEPAQCRREFALVRRDLTSWGLVHVLLAARVQAPAARQWLRAAEADPARLADPWLATVRAAVALAADEPPPRVDELETLFRRMMPGAKATLAAAETVAEALEAAGRPENARRVLEDATRDRVVIYYPNQFPLLQWVRARALLAVMSHRVGRHDEAAAIELELRRLLSRADPDFQVLETLR